MHIQGDEQLIRPDASPEAKIYPPVIPSHHPAQKHVQAFTTGFPFGSGDVFARSLRCVGQAEEQPVKAGQRPLRIRGFRSEKPGESIFQTFLLAIVVLEEFEKVQGVGNLKGAVFEGKKFFPVFFPVLEYEVVRSAVHQLNKFMGFIDDGLALPPGQYRRPKAHDLDVLFFGEPVGDANGVVRNERGAVVLIYVSVENSFNVGGHTIRIFLIGG
jgi:hypothetical protein